MVLPLILSSNKVILTCVPKFTLLANALHYRPSLLFVWRCRQARAGLLQVMRVNRAILALVQCLTLAHAHTFLYTFFFQRLDPWLICRLSIPDNAFCIAFIKQYFLSRVTNSKIVARPLKSLWTVIPVALRYTNQCLKLKWGRYTNRPQPKRRHKQQWPMLHKTPASRNDYNE